MSNIGLSHFHTCTQIFLVFTIGRQIKSLVILACLSVSVTNVLVVKRLS